MAEQFCLSGGYFMRAYNRECKDSKRKTVPAYTQKLLAVVKSIPESISKCEQSIIITHFPVSLAVGWMTRVLLPAGGGFFVITMSRLAVCHIQPY
jgi:hypothetical protein